MDSKITLKDVSVILAQREVLHGMNLSFTASEFVSIVGKNGAGKSTLLRAIAALLPYNGSIVIDHQESSVLSRKQLAKHISFLPQKMSVIYPIPVREFILMGRYPYMRPLSGYSHDDIKSVDSIIERLCLEEVSERNLHELSGGEQQRVLLASALVQEAKFVLLDEPAAFLDPVQQEILYESLKDVNSKEGIGIILASHHLNLSLQYSSRIVALGSGGVVFDGTPDDFKRPETLTETYGRLIQL